MLNYERRMKMQCRTPKICKSIFKISELIILKLEFNAKTLKQINVQTYDTISRIARIETTTLRDCEFYRVITAPALRPFFFKIYQNIVFSKVELDGHLTKS